MRKTFILLFSLLLVLGAFVLEGGALKTLFVATALIPVSLGTLLGALFCFSMGDIATAFRDAFTETAIPDKLGVYKNDLLIIKNMQIGLIFWSATMVILGIIGILSSLTEVSNLGRSMAAAFTALLLAFSLRALLLTPMESSIQKKLNSIQQ